MSEKKFEDILKNKVEDYETNHDAGLWDKIASELPAEKKNRRLLIPLFSVLLLTSSIGWVVFQSEKNRAAPLQETEQKQTNKFTPPPLDQAEKPQDGPSQKNTESGRVSEATAVKPQKSVTLNSNSRRATLSSPVRETAGLSTNKLLPAKENLQQNPIILSEKAGLDSTADSQHFLYDTTIILASLEQAATDSLLLKKTAQDTAVKTQPSAAYPPSFYLGFSYGFMHSNPRLNQTNPSSQTFLSPDEFDARQAAYKGKTSSAIQVYAGMEFRKHRLELGLNRFQIVYQIPVSNINKAIINGAVTSFSRFDYSATDSFKFTKKEEGGYYVKNRFTYLGIPLSYAYRLMQIKGVSISLSAQTSANFLIQEKGLLNERNSGFLVKENKAVYNDLQSVHFNYGLSLKLGYPLNRNLQLLVSPAFLNAFTPIEKGEIETRYSAWTIGIGLELKLN